MITLLDGRQIDPASVNFDTSTYHFYYGGEDITNLIRRADKIATWPNFDMTVDNNRIFNEDVAAQGNANLGAVQNILGGVDATSTGQVGSTSTFGNFYNQITTDPLNAPLASADNLLKNSLASLFKSWTGWLILGAVALFLYIKLKK